MPREQQEQDMPALRLEEVQTHEYVAAMRSLDVFVAPHLFSSHESCHMQGEDCSVPLRMRSIALEAKLDEATILERVREIRATGKTYVADTLDGILHRMPSADIILQINGTNVPIPQHVLSGALSQWSTKAREHSYRMGQAVFAEANSQIATARSTKIPPALAIPAALMRAGVQVNLGPDLTYHYLVPAMYAPRWIVHEKTRVLSEEHQAALRRLFKLCFIVHSRTTVPLVVGTLEMDGNPFTHYHGDGTHCCWGQVKPPPTLTLDNLAEVASQYIGNLRIVNADSPMHSNPKTMPPMPTITELLKDSVVMAKSEEAKDMWTVANLVKAAKQEILPLQEAMLWKT